MKRSISIFLLLTIVMLSFSQILTSCSAKRDAPEVTPTQEEVFAALSEASKEAMDLFYESYWDRTRCGYFFDENCSIAILNGETSYNEAGVPIYTATVESKRSWKYVDVTETETVNYIYNSESREWELDNYVIENVVGKWHVDGEYQGEDGCSFRIETGDYVSGGSDLLYEEFDFMTSNYTKAIFTLRNEKGEVYTDEMVRLYAPCSKGIATGGGSFNPDEKDNKSTIYVIAHVYPEKIFYIDHMAPAYKKIALS